ncbi:MAG TPA: ATP-binding cassette domain-containing protein, partial [Candidatus Acidoferrum sp.]|nr:ATP-binding cassette domain-containing protein [Candidatus Acidoferrum sp.]
MLAISGINVKYGPIHAVRGVSLSVDAGEIVTIIGANGAGKSTVLKTLVGLLQPTTGDILLDGESLLTL